MAACNTVQKLFAYGKVADILAKDTMTLLLYVEGKGTAKVVKKAMAINDELSCRRHDARLKCSFCCSWTIPANGTSQNQAHRYAQSWHLNITVEPRHNAALSEYKTECLPNSPNMATTLQSNKYDLASKNLTPTPVPASFAHQARGRPSTSRSHTHQQVLSTNKNDKHETNT